MGFLCLIQIWMAFWWNSKLFTCPCLFPLKRIWFWLRFWLTNLRSPLYLPLFFFYLPLFYIQVIQIFLSFPWPLDPRKELDVLQSFRGTSFSLLLVTHCQISASVQVACWLPSHRSLSLTGVPLQFSCLYHLHSGSTQSMKTGQHINSLGFTPIFFSGMGYQIVFWFTPASPYFLFEFQSEISII